MVVADSQLSVTDAWGSTLWYFKRKSPTALEGVSDRHNGKAMLSFADGHAAAEDAVVVNGIDDPADIDQGKSFWIPNNRWYVPF
jgi:prepilin-type processing-associated H-X9-DG protein